MVYRFLILIGLLAAGQYSVAGVRMIPDEVSSCEPKVRVLSIGVSRYQNPEFTAQFASADAIAFSEAFVKLGTESPATLTDAAATQAGIEAALTALTQQAKTCDTVVFFFSGWGTGGGGVFYLFPSDMPREEDRRAYEASARSHAISTEVLWAWLGKLQARNLLIILDTGDATEFLVTTLSKMRSSGDQERNVSVIVPQGNSWDDQKSHHGTLTYAVLTALTKDSDLNNDGLLSEAELAVAASANVLRAAQSTGHVFRATSFSTGTEFAIGRVGSAKPESSMRGSRTYAQLNPAPRPTLNGKYRALLIATNEYKEWDPLRNPIPDAQAIAQELESTYGFEKPTLVLNPTRAEMIKAVTDLRKLQFGPDDELFIFIAGHGTYDPIVKTGFLVATDSLKDDPGHATYYSQYDLFRWVAALPAQHVFAVIDACQAGEGMAQLRGDDPKGDFKYKPGEKLEGLLERKGRHSRLWMTSGGNEYVPDGEGRHSPFANQLLRALVSGTGPDSEGIITFLDVLNYAQRVPSPAPQPAHGLMPDNQPGSDFWFVAKPELRGQQGNVR